MVMLMFTAIWKKKIPTTLYAYTLEKVLLCLSAIRINLNKKNKYKPKNVNVPTNPNASPSDVKIKSVFCSGTYFPLVWVPFKKPLPQNPPDPMAILLCLTL